MVAYDHAALEVLLGGALPALEDEIDRMTARVLLDALTGRPKMPAVRFSNARHWLRQLQLSVKNEAFAEGRAAERDSIRKRLGL